MSALVEIIAMSFTFVTPVCICLNNHQNNYQTQYVVSFVCENGVFMDFISL